MAYILVYEPRRGLIYFLQKYKGNWELNGLRGNAYEFSDYSEAEEVKRIFGHYRMFPQIKEASQEKEA